MLFKYTGFVLIVLITLLFAADKIPVPNDAADYSEKYIVTDPNSGDAIISNQLVMVFSQEVTRRKQNQILNRIGGEIVGGIPDMDMYQVRIKNDAASLSKIQRVCAQISNDKYVTHASPRTVPTGKISKIEIKNAKPVRRSGNLDLAPAERAAPETKDPMITTLEAHRVQLYDCLKSTAIQHGNIEYRITINPDGEVISHKILSSTVRDKGLKDCLAHKIRKWADFPEHNKKQNRQLEFTFAF